VCWECFGIALHNFIELDLHIWKEKKNGMDYINRLKVCYIDELAWN
jgi:hypothetical protein